MADADPARKIKKRAGEDLLLSGHRVVHAVYIQFLTQLNLVLSQQMMFPQATSHGVSCERGSHLESIRYA